MIEVLLRCLDRLRRIFELLGVDFDHLRAILEAKLTIDARRRYASLGQRPVKRASNFFLISLVAYAVLGGLVGVALLRWPTPLVSLTIVHSFIMMFVCMALITDFSSVLLDQTDNTVLLPRAVSGRTILFARIVHVSVYVGLITGSLAFGAMVIGTWLFGGWFLLVFLVSLASSAVLCVFGVNLLYLTALRLMDSERLRDIILYCQITMAVLFLSSYQLLPRLMASTRFGAVSLEDRWWIYLFPPSWFAAPIDLLSGNVGTPQLALTALGILVPVACVALVARSLAPGFGAALLKLEGAPPVRNGEAMSRRARTPARSWASRWAALVCRSPREQTAFELTWKLSSRDRPFKLRTYPTVAFVFVLPVIFFSSSQVVLGVTLDELLETRAYLFLLYVCCSLVPTSIMHLRISDQHAASWIYATVPLERPGEMLLAGLKVVLVRLVLPAFALVAAATLALWGAHVIPDIMLAFCVLILTSSLQALSFGRCFPFSQPFDVLRSFERVTRSLTLMALPGVLGYLHFALGSQIRVAAAIPVVLATAALMLRAYARTDWHELST